ncbi:MAG TPA: hypothetical protein VHZ98_09765 [Galbitalea sp.]|jgi:hypothetical protein|nr:hypothetical protein [Galbitalea sp.]
MSEAPATKPFNRLALVGIICPALALIALLVWIVLGLASASTTFGGVISPFAITVTAVLVPILYLLGIVFGIVGIRRWKRLGGRGLAIAAIVVSSALLIVTVLFAVVAALFLNLLSQAGG